MRHNPMPDENLIFEIPAHISFSRNIDGVVHILLIGHATFIRNRPPIMDGGLVVPAYTSDLGAAAGLFDIKLKSASWSLERNPEQDLVGITLPNSRECAARGSHGQAPACLTFLLLALQEDISRQDAWVSLIERIAESAGDPQLRRELISVDGS